MDTLIYNARIMQPGEGLIATWLRMSGGKIAGFGTSMPDADGKNRVDAGWRLLTPGLIDMHTHGIGRCAYEPAPDDLRRCLAEAPRFGTTCVLPTLYALVTRQRFGELAELAAALDAAGGAAAPGFHFEGPFVAMSGAASQTLAGDVGLLESLVEACGGRMAAMSLSPETKNILPVIERLRDMRVATFVTHTQAGVEETEAAIAAGARHATHFYDVFYAPKETEPGVRPVGAVEAFLADPLCTVDFICDGVHVHPTAVKAALAAKGPRGVALITDSNIGAGLPAGVYQTPGGPARVSPQDAARIDDPNNKYYGGLFGSSLTMDRGICNLMRWLDLPACDVWALGTSNPARIVGLADKGVIRIGADADLVLWDEKTQAGEYGLAALRTWVGGRLVYAAGGQ